MRGKKIYIYIYIDRYIDIDIDIGRYIYIFSQIISSSKFYWTKLEILT